MPENQKIYLKHIGLKILKNKDYFWTVDCNNKVFHVLRQMQEQVLQRRFADILPYKYPTL